MEILQETWKQHLRPRAVVGYGVNIFLPSPPNYGHQITWKEPLTLRWSSSLLLLLLFAFRRRKTHPNRVVLRMFRISSTGIDRDASVISGFGRHLARTGWLTGTHHLDLVDVIVNLSCLYIGFVSQFPQAQIKAVKIPLISTCLAVMCVGCSAVFFAVFPKVDRVVLIYSKCHQQI